MEIEEYRAQFIDQLRFDADHEGTEPETQFILKTENVFATSYFSIVCE